MNMVFEGSFTTSMHCEFHEVQEHDKQEWVWAQGSCSLLWVLLWVLAFKALSAGSAGNEHLRRGKGGEAQVEHICQRYTRYSHII